MTLRLLENVGGDLHVNAGCGFFTFGSPNDVNDTITIACDNGTFDTQIYFCNSTESLFIPHDCDESNAIEVIHASCSVDIVVGQPAPKDDPKGDPSELLFVESFVEGSGRVVEPFVNDGPGECPGILSDPDPVKETKAPKVRFLLNTIRGRRKLGMREGKRDTRALKSKGDSDPTEDITVSYQCQYNVTNTGSANVTVMVDSTESTSIDIGTLLPSASDIFLLDYNCTAGVCPNVTVNATGGECTDSASWPADDIL